MTWIDFYELTWQEKYIFAHKSSLVVSSLQKLELKGCQIYLVVKHKFSSCIWFVQVIQIVQHGWIGKHKVHDFMTKQSTELGNNLKEKKNMIYAQENLKKPQRILENPR